MPVSPAELHGHLLGRVCAGAGFDEAAWQHAAAELLGGAPGERLKAALSGLLGMVRQDFSAGEVAVVMLLPDDETPLAQRTEALGQWCQGFLAGFGLTAREGSLTGEAEEVLQDMAAIAQVQASWKTARTARRTIWKSWNTCGSLRCCCSPSAASRWSPLPSLHCTEVSA